MKLIDVWFAQLEQDDFRLASAKELKDAVTTVGMYLTRDIKIRAADDTGMTGAGSSVRKYAGAFRSNVAPNSKRAKPALVAPDEEDDESAA